jgi:hypothetical protein
MRTPPAYSALGFSKRQATALINGVLFHNNTHYGKKTNERREVEQGK